MEFTLRYTGPLKSGRHHLVQAKHQIRCALHEQLADYWNRDHRLTQVRVSELQPPMKTIRHRYDVRPIDGSVGGPTSWFYAHSVAGIRFVPLVTAWRFLRCELSVRLYRYEGDELHGRLLEGNGDLDNQLKTLLDALRMPHHKDELPRGCSHSGDAFFCLLEDDCLISRLTLDTRQILGPRPADTHQVQVDLDVKIVPIRTMGLNMEMLYP
jgi:hypothetical protein